MELDRDGASNWGNMNCKPQGTYIGKSHQKYVICRPVIDRFFILPKLICWKAAIRYVDSISTVNSS